MGKSHQHQAKPARYECNMGRIYTRKAISCCAYRNLLSFAPKICVAPCIQKVTLTLKLNRAILLISPTLRNNSHKINKCSLSLPRYLLNIKGSDNVNKLTNI